MIIANAVEYLQCVNMVLGINPVLSPILIFNDIPILIRPYFMRQELLSLFCREETGSGKVLELEDKPGFEHKVGWVLNPCFLPHCSRFTAVPVKVPW